jgi:hypothetical protein
VAATPGMQSLVRVMSAHQFRPDHEHVGSEAESRFFVQLPFQHAAERVTVASATARPSAAAYAGAAFLNARDESGRAAE